MAFLDVTSCIEPESETKEDPELSDLLMAMTMTRRAEILIVARASSTEDTSTTCGGSGHSSEEASKK